MIENKGYVGVNTKVRISYRYPESTIKREQHKTKRQKKDKTRTGQKGQPQHRVVYPEMEETERKEDREREREKKRKIGEGKTKQREEDRGRQSKEKRTGIERWEEEERK